MSTPESRPEEAPETAAAPGTEGTPETPAAPGTEGMPETAAAPGTEGMPETAAAPGNEGTPETTPDDLRAAVGLSEQPERRGAQPRGPRWRIALLIGAIALLGVVVAGLVVMGRQNRQRYYLVCGEDDITAAQGRRFPPWGRSALDGKAWQAIPRPLEAPCEDRVFDSREGLARRFGETLVARAEAWVIARADGAGREQLAEVQAQLGWVIARADGAGREQLAEVQAQLDQALRVLRELRGPQDPGPGLAELSGKIQRLRGDLDYWQARDRIDTAMAELASAAQHLDSAVANDPHHNREQALEWQRALARLQAELGAGPAGPAAPGAAAGSARPGAAAGTALPAAPGTPAQPGMGAPSVPLDGGPAPAPGSTSDAGPTPAPQQVPGAAGPGTPQPPPDAGTPRGGLLI